MSSVVIAFMRCNPPTLGHKLVWDKVRSTAQKERADWKIFLSATSDHTKNPLTPNQKLGFCQKIYPQGKQHFEIAGGNLRTFIEVAKNFSGKYDDFIMVAGSDRVDEFKRLLKKYNGSEFQYKNVSVVSAGERDPDSDSVSGISGTKMRRFAMDKDLDGIIKGTGLLKPDAEEMMRDLRAGMRLGESISFSRFCELFYE